jgi:hypothetical protein
MTEKRMRIGMGREMGIRKGWGWTARKRDLMIRTITNMRQDRKL